MALRRLTIDIEPASNFPLREDLFGITIKTSDNGDQSYENRTKAEVLGLILDAVTESIKSFD